MSDEGRQLPAELIVGPRTYAIHWDADSWNQYVEEKEAWGETNHKTLDIYIAPLHAPQQRADTLLHEALHCVISMTADPINYKEMQDLEEHLVSSMTPWLMMVLLDNPEMLDFLESPF